MEADQFFYLVIILSLIGSVILMFPKFFKIIAKIGINMVVGLGIIYVLNLVIPGESYRVGLNVYTGATTGILGIPGVALLYVVRIFI